jgi:glycosyltransferase involved in cell wall biosynthesis
LDKPALLAGARALVVPAEEDFGIVPLEAIAAGTPIIAFASGGFRESCPPTANVTWFGEQSRDALMNAVLIAIEREAEAAADPVPLPTAETFRRQMSEYLAAACL